MELIMSPEINFYQKVKHLIIAVCALSFYPLYCQIPSYNDKTTLNENIYDLKAFNTVSNYLLLTAKGKPFEGNINQYTFYESYYNYIYLLNEELKVIDSLVLKQMAGYELMVFKAFISNNDQVILTGRACDTVTQLFNYFAIKLDSQFNIVDEFLYGDTENSENVKTIINSVDGNILFYGLINHEWDKEDADDEYVQFYTEIDFDGNVISSIIDTMDFNLGWLRTVGNSGIYHGRSPGLIYALNSNFSITDTFDFPVENFEDYSYKNFEGDSYFILGDLLIPPIYPSFDTDISFLLVDSQAELLSAQAYGAEDTIDRFPNIDFRYTDTLFICGIKNYNNGYGDSWVSLYKTNLDGVKFYEKYIGGYGKYSSSFVLATDDGGCIIVASWWDFYTYPELWIDKTVMFKVNANGLLTSTFPSRFMEENYDILIYPNPGNEVFKVNSDLTDLTIKLFELSGKFILEQSFDRQVSINTSNLETGTYIYFIYQDKKQVKSGKWIKAN